MENCDVLILGAGPAGSVTAGLLAKAGLKVIILEKSGFEKPRVGESLAPGVKPLLQTLELWEQFIALNPLPSYGTRSAWGDSNAESHTHMLTTHGTGWHVDRLILDRMIVSEAEKTGVIVVTDCRLLNCNYGDIEGFRSQVRHKDDEFSISSKFVVDASGRNAFLSTHLGAERIVFDRLVGVAVQFEDNDSGNNLYTMVEASEVGWWYSAPVSQNTSVAMLMTDGDLAAKIKLDQLQVWQSALNITELTAKRLNDSNIKWGPTIFSAVSQRVIRQAIDNRPWLTVGDAALAVDPISGSGVIRALSTAKEAANTVIAVLNGDDQAILNYESNRNEDCHKYLTEWAAYYDMEQRWLHAPFWKRRAMAIQSYLSNNK
jgi:flavin-dependent dehydrogenase